MSEALRDLGERGFISRLRGAFPELMPLGDDAAVLNPLSCPVATTDSFVEGRHFLRWWCDPGILAARLLEATLSDLAAMGAEPGHILVSLACPGDVEWSWLSGFYRGLASRRDCPVAGGETVSASELVITLTAIGEGGESSGLLRRGGMREGDALWLTGRIGRALDIAGLIQRCGGLEGPSLEPVNPVGAPELEQVRAFLAPRAQFDEAGRIRRAGVRCAIDISDGLFSEAAHLSKESGAAVEIELDSVPLFESARDRPVEACAAGEDFVLLFAAPPGLDFTGDGFARIGRAVGGEGLKVLSGGLPVDIGRSGFGYDHYR